MERVAKKLGVSLDDVIAIGDNQNDIAMIQKAGLGVAVANARKETLEQADYVTLSNNDDGVAHVIEKFCKE
jgi:hydroxymethylpyrimidine pyrophosphatase-like HAD family hydrolase